MTRQYAALMISDYGLKRMEQHMSFLKKLFGGGDDKGNAKPVEEVEHEGYLVATTPIPEGGQYRLSALITKEIDGELYEHQLIRADLFTNTQDASQAAIRKAKQVIKEQGDKMFS
ncbi:MAG: HlyU family transcriptional regulator [Rhizobiaceae bacterium]